MISFVPDVKPLFNPVVMVSCLRGRIVTRKALLEQSQARSTACKGR